MEKNKTQIIYLKKLPIRLGQLLKISDLVQDGVEAKFYIEEGLVQVNNGIERRRGKKIVAGDLVLFQGVELQVHDAMKEMPDAKKQD